ncbi:MAG: VCBS repeat-containing protein, partial [Pirellulaceae bacterium]
MKRLLIFLVATLCPLALQAEDLERLRYNHPGLVVDLGVGLWAWPLPVDYDQDGDLDLLVSCPDKPANGIYFFENPDGNVTQPVFLPGKRIAPGQRNITISHLPGGPRIMIPGREFTGWRENQFTDLKPVYPGTNLLPRDRKIRTNQWSLVDLDGDDVLEMVVGVGEWTDYGWDDAYNSEGAWTNGPLHGWVYVIRAGAEEGSWLQPELLRAGGMPIDVFGKPAPNFADFDGNGDLDLVCGEFLDKFTYFQNTGTRKQPVYAAGRRLLWRGRPLAMQLQMIVPSAIDWDRDGDVDLVVGDEDGRVALVEHSGRVVDGLPRFLPPVYFRQQADEVKFGALATPVGFDWDGDGDDDILCGNTAGQVAWIENLSGAGQFPPRWSAPRLLEAAGKPIQIMAGPNGSIQGPCEAKWGYTTLTAGDWDHDGRPDLVVNSIWGRVTWYRNIGSRIRPRLAAARPVEVAWPGETPRPAWNWWKPKGKELVTQWRT